MALIGTRMHRDSVGAEALAGLSHLGQVGIVFATRIAQSGYFIYIYA